MDIQQIINGRIGVGLGYGLGRAVPPSLGLRLADWVGRGLSRQRGQAMVRAVRCNQWVVSGGQLSGTALDRAVSETFAHTAYTLYTYYHHLSQARQDANGAPILELPQKFLQILMDAQASQTGLIVVGLHMGNFDLAIQAAARMAGEQAGLRGLVLSFPEPGKGYQWQNKLRQQGNLEIIPASLAAIRKAEQCLAGGGVVLSGIDRPLVDMKYRPQFFGRPASLPVLHIPLALRSKAPILVAAVLLQPDRTYRLMISELFKVKEYPDRQKEILVNAETLLEAAEEFIRCSPQQWSMYYPVWPEAMAEMESI